MYLSSPDTPEVDEAGDTFRSEVGETAELAIDVSDPGVAITEEDGGNEVVSESVPGVHDRAIVEGDRDAEFGVGDISGRTAGTTELVSEDSWFDCDERSSTLGSS